MRPVQYFTTEYLAQCRAMKPDQILRFLEDFRILRRPARAPKSRLISMKVPEDMLGSFKARCHARGTPYQAQIKVLMRAWLTK
ncbi:MAG: CopG family antitoxin [Elusimicrobiota bacterium]